MHRRRCEQDSETSSLLEPKENPTPNSDKLCTAKELGHGGVSHLQKA